MASAPGAPPELELAVFDLRGRAVDPEAMPRQVRFFLPVSLDPQGPGPSLFEGPADAELLRDLERLPLNAAHQRRVVPLSGWPPAGRADAPPPTRTGAGMARAANTNDSAGGSAVAPPPVPSGSSAGASAGQPRFAPQHTLARAARYTFALPRNALPALTRDRLQQAFVRELQTADSPAAGAAVSGTFPADGSAGVATALRFALLMLDGEASGMRDGVWLEDEGGLAVPTQVDSQPCETLESRASTCVRLQPLTPLAPGRRYLLQTGSALRDAQGAPIEPFSAQFTTSDGAPPAELGWLAGACGLDELSVPVGCARPGEDTIELRLFPDAPAQLVAQLGNVSVAHITSGAAVSATFSGLRPNAHYALSVSASDSLGRTQLVPFELDTAPRLATLSISELRADPLGSEPAQEYVELWNYGERAVQLQDLSLSDAPDAPGTRIAAALELPAGGRALLVSDDFDPANTLDVGPAPGAPLVRVGSTLTRSGLANAGEALYLRDRENHRLSAAPALPPSAAGTCIARVVDDPRSGEPAAFAPSVCTPGR